VKVQFLHEKEVVHQIKCFLSVVMVQDLQLPLRCLVMGFEGSHQLYVRPVVASELPCISLDGCPQKGCGYNEPLRTTYRTCGN
jgi:hypothetical protein